MQLYSSASEAGRPRRFFCPGPTVFGGFERHSNIVHTASYCRSCGHSSHPVSNCHRLARRSPAHAPDLREAVCCTRSCDEKACLLALTIPAVTSNVGPRRTPPSGSICASCLYFRANNCAVAALTPFCSLLLAQVSDALSMSDSEASAEGFPKEFELHARMLVGAVTGLFWLSNPGAPASQVRDALNALPVYSSRVIALGALHEQLHDSVQQLLRRMLAHVLKVRFCLQRTPTVSFHATNTILCSFTPLEFLGKIRVSLPHSPSLSLKGPKLSIKIASFKLVCALMCSMTATWLITWILGSRWHNACTRS